MGKGDLLALLLAGAALVGWMLNLQSNIHEAFRTDLEWKLRLEGEVDEHHRALCTYQSHTGHMGCAD